MRRSLLAFLCVFATAFPTSAQEAETKKPTDGEIAKVLIQQSIDEYDGSCPCPYNTMRNGRRCGGNSAYSRPGGEEPLCYRKDVSDEMIAAYRSSHEQ